MESKCRKYWQAGIPCPPSQPASVLTEASGLATSLNEQGNPRSIAFGVEPQARDNPGRIVPIPGYDAPSLPLKPLRDPALSLIALSGVDPSGPVMVEVPLVENNTAFTATHALGGRRVGFAERFVDDHEEGRIEHPPSFLKALGILRQAGTELVPVPAHRANQTLHTRNEIDELVRALRLVALVSDSRSSAFHSACWSGYPGVGAPLEDGATLWFYGARWAKDWLPALVQGYQNVCRLMDRQDEPPAALNYPTR
ncbi:hypothetical protein SAMN05216248_10816 [Pseudomonas simiae]|nr:hypothetical protein SAMN05216248_10816 [Pseudomonas simiae]